jgi:L-2-hydroxycarboxylate dehydrogenase (NAD+)
VPLYAARLRSGELNGRPRPSVVRRAGAVALVDGDSGPGQVAGVLATDLSIELARAHGTGIVSVRRSGHYGAAAIYAVRAAEAGMVGLSMTNAPPGVVPYGGLEAGLGTNPIALAAPARREAPLLFDAATSAIAGNKIRLAIRVGSPLLAGWVTDKDGTPIMEEKPVFNRDEYHQAPLGGTREQGSHKGYGFALMAEVLSTVLSGALPTMLAAGSGSKNHFAAYNIEAFTEIEHFKDTMDEMLRTLRTAEPAPGQERVLYPGLSEFEEVQLRRAEGIPLHKEVLQWFAECTSELGLPPLATMR